MSMSSGRPCSSPALPPARSYGICCQHAFRILILAGPIWSIWRFYLPYPAMSVQGHYALIWTNMKAGLFHFSLHRLYYMTVSMK